MGLFLESSSGPWVLDSGGSSTVYQLERAQSSSASSQDISSTTELDCLNQDRQYDQPLLHQQTRRNLISPSTGTSYGSLDMVSTAPNHDTGTTHSGFTEYNSRFRISPKVLQEAMDDQTIDFSTTTSNLGPVFHRSLRRQNDQVITKVRILDARSGCIPHGCVLNPMEAISEPIHKSSMESNFASTESNTARTTSSGNSRGTVLAECSVVPSPSANGSLSSMDVASTSGTNNLSQNSSPPTTAELDALRVEIIKQQLLRKNVHAQAVEDLLTQKLAPTGTNLGYRKNQLRFLAWAIQHNVSCTSFSAVDLVNFLADMRRVHGLQASTLKTLRSAVAHLHDEPKGIRDSDLINSYIDSMIKQAPPVSIHRPTVDVSPALNAARSIASRTTTSIKLLQQDLAFLLAMAAFLRPSDLARIPFASCNISDNGCLVFQVVTPKETRGKRRIIKPFTVHPHASDVELCPVQCFKALRDHPGLASRPTGSQLFVKSHLIQQPLSSSTISSWLHRHFIALCNSEPNVSIRSLASSRALDLGVSGDSIVTLGNWTSSSTFENHYQRNQMAQVDFTSTILSDPVDQFFDAAEVFSLD